MSVFWMALAKLVDWLPSWAWVVAAREFVFLKLIAIMLDNEDAIERAIVAQHLRDFIAGDKTAMDRLMERIARWETSEEER